MDASRQDEGVPLQLDEKTDSTEEGGLDAAVAPGLGSLPEELLQRILALLPVSWPRQQQPGGAGGEAAAAFKDEDDEDDPSLAGEAPGLLTLRLVCRRWARSVLAPAVWRHRKLVFSDERPPSAVGLPRLLRLAPALDELSAVGVHETEQMVILGALADSHCKFRSLQMYSALPSASALAVRTLERRRASLNELHLELLPDDPDAAKYGYEPLLEVVDAMENLDTLTLGSWNRYGHTVRFQFRRLSTLHRLHLFEGLHHSTIRSLLAGSKDTLREVYCYKNDMAHLLAEEAPSVREVGVCWAGSGKMLDSLRHLPDLELLKLRVEGAVSSWHENLARFLQSSPLVPRKVQLSLPVRPFFRWDSLAVRMSMNRITTVSVSIDTIWPSKSEPYEPPSLPLSLQFVEVLELELENASNDDWVAFKSCWCSATAPRLRELHLHDCSDCHDISGKDEVWVEQLRAQRPQLKLCTLPVELCPAAIYWDV